MTATAEPNEGFKETEIGLLPEDWNIYKIDDLARVTKLAGFEFTKYMRYTTSGEIIALRALNLNNGKLNLNNIQRISAKVSDELPRSKLYKDELLLSYVGTVGSVAIVPEDNKFHLAPNVSKISIQDKGLANNVFLMFYFLSPIGKSELLSNVSKTSQPVISMARIRTLKVSLPSLPEQQKIASVLSAVQEAKEKTENVLSALKELKKSMMKHLFTYGAVTIEEAERVPLKETEIGMIPEHWQVLELEQLVEIKGGKRLLKGHSFSGSTTPFPYIRIVDFMNNTVRMTDLKYLTLEDRHSIKNYIIRDRDIYISIAGTIGLVGTVPAELDGANLTENAARLIIKDVGQLDKHYVVAYLSSAIGQHEIEIRTTKTSQPKLALTRIKQIPIAFPCLSEQLQVSKAISAIDEKIRAEENKKNSLDTLFKTLLSLLMTGKIRVKDIEIPV